MAIHLHGRLLAWCHVCLGSYIHGALLAASLVVGMKELKAPLVLLGRRVLILGAYKRLLGMQRRTGAYKRHLGMQRRMGSDMPCRMTVVKVHDAGHALASVA
jgi:hypothetical protein